MGAARAAVSAAAAAADATAAVRGTDSEDRLLLETFDLIAARRHLRWASGAAGASAFVEIKGRTREGDSCECTSPPPAPDEPVEEPSIFRKILAWLHIYSLPKLSREAQLAKFSKEQREAMVKNANMAVDEAGKDFEQLAADFQMQMSALKAAYANFAHAREHYHEAFLRSEDEHAKTCEPLTRLYNGVALDCERRRLKESDRFLARYKHPDCVVGRHQELDSPDEASLPAVALALAALAPAAPRGGSSGRQPRMPGSTWAKGDSGLESGRPKSMCLAKRSHAGASTAFTMPGHSFEGADSAHVSASAQGQCKATQSNVQASSCQQAFDSRSPDISFNKRKTEINTAGPPNSRTSWMPVEKEHRIIPYRAAHT
eukprot:TRINITY_DN49789_c0_g1_i1.p2 TRINITY_DN49789_c0_g1~~TRINITY_DN49789_c0_g1_i1.p2  ORF type:complete len:373 (-),score=84.03 TRINITY_DN49789_c0_g1_i1:840-1958(-)